MIDKNILDSYIQGLYDDDGNLSPEDYQKIINFITANGEPELNTRDLIQIRRGNEGDLPVLAQGEIGYTLDSEELFIGGLGGNVKVAKKDEVVNVKEYGATGDGVTDDTTAIGTALTLANSTKRMLYFPSGEYIVTSNMIIPDNGVKIVYGDGKNSTIIKFKDITGFALTIQSYYTRNVTLKDMTIRLADTTQKVSGLRVNYNGTWGGSCVLDNVNIDYFTIVGVELDECFNVSFNDGRIFGYQDGGINYTKLLVVSKGSTFSNVLNFKSFVFHRGTIGIQNVGGSALNFINCTFEDLDLFHHISQVAGLSMYETFESCWFEIIDKGIINADINETTLTPIEPVANKAGIKRLNFDYNNVSTGVVSPFLNEIVEPYLYDDFTPIKGLGYLYEKTSYGLTWDYDNGLETNVPDLRLISQVMNLDELAFKPSGVFESGAMVITVEALGYNDSKMHAVFITSNYQTDAVLQGAIKDPDTIGSDYKIDLVWASSLSLRVKAYAQGLKSVKVKTTMLRG